jgi:hypothetical protein
MDNATQTPIGISLPLKRVVERRRLQQETVTVPTTLLNGLTYEQWMELTTVILAIRNVVVQDWDSNRQGG